MTVVIILLLMAFFAWALRATLRDLRSSGGCSNCCSACGGKRPISVKKRKHDALDG